MVRIKVDAKHKYDCSLRKMLVGEAFEPDTGDRTIHWYCPANRVAFVTAALALHGHRFKVE